MAPFERFVTNVPDGASTNRSPMIRPACPLANAAHCTRRIKIQSFIVCKPRKHQSVCCVCMPLDPCLFAIVDHIRSRLWGNTFSVCPTINDSAERSLQLDPRSLVCPARTICHPRTLCESETSNSGVPFVEFNRSVRVNSNSNQVIL
jgi:hypothetical protein